MSTATRIGTIKAAKDCLVGKIADEAQRQGVPLSKVEREMLYFTEDGGLSKHMEKVCAEFDRECNDEEYEAKIGGIVRSLLPRLTPEEQEMWDDAVLKLSEGDHYLMALIDAGAEPKIPLFSIPRGLQAWLPSVDLTQPRPPGDRRRLILVALIPPLIFIVFLLLFGRR